MHNKPRRVHYVHQVVPVARGPSVGLAAEERSQHRTASQLQSQPWNSLAADHYRTQSPHQLGPSVAVKSSDPLDSAASRYYMVLVRGLPQIELRSALETGQC